MVGGVETSEEGGDTQESDKVKFEEFTVSCDGGGSMPGQRNMTIYQHVHCINMNMEKRAGNWKLEM